MARDRKDPKQVGISISLPPHIVNEMERIRDLTGLSLSAIVALKWCDYELINTSTGERLL